ncbi:hypothetical protein F5J12DRAFT_840168 [Pisolithus orientalis]|uniref:uncharacterized protein n=1 Tax=Pisolithus orientalis TaxID=936130 RepID=UPI002224918C|nr:uncharacterized protein F5J12DRAFT_840168 [Pisolithus orientalis]KAI6002621.1 hypothetical protein F5J12DRAFT_840168 [Pisolithus orientalis]
MDLVLLCWIRGEEEVFKIKIPRSADVGDLKEVLKDSNSVTFKDVDAKNISLFPLLVPSGANRADELGKWRFKGKKHLDATQKLSDVFLEISDGEWVVIVTYPTARMEFQVYFKNQILPVSALAQDKIKIFLSDLRDRQHKDLFRDIRISKLTVYRLNPPVLEAEGADYLENLEPIKDSDTVELSFGESTVTRDHVCLALLLEAEESSQAIAALERNHTRIFSSLKIIVTTPLKWTMDDVHNNLRGGRYTESERADLPEIVEIQQLLGSDRIYNLQALRTNNEQQNKDFEIALEYPEGGDLFGRIFKTFSDEARGLMVRNEREFATFYHILRCFREDASKICAQRSSSIKAGNFAAYFIQPPFFSDGGTDIKYETEMPWGFPIFIGNRDAADALRKYKPKSDLMATSARHLNPFFVSEVISLKQEDDRFRMLLQAIAAARAGKILLKETAKRKFFVVAVYLNKDLVASRYIVMQTGQDNAEHAEAYRQGNAVSIHCNHFNLTIKSGAIEFVREMYNLVGELNNLAEDLDNNRARTLKQLVDAAKGVLSLHSKNHPVAQLRASRMDAIPEHHAGEEEHVDVDEDEDGLGVFGADDVQEHLLNMKCMVDYRVFGHENLAVVRSKTDGRVGYLKFVETARHQEVRILQFLGGIQSPMNHTISGAEFWPVQDGTMISMPVAGGHLTSLDRPDEHLWSAASQLVEGVAFMHAQLVAHMDLKPDNIIIPLEGGYLSIIDFSSSIRLQSEKQKFRGIAGTTGYIAPEVERGDAYKPIQADLWSCGRTLEVLCSICKPSPDRDFLLDVAAELKSENPERRPAMSKVQEWMASRKGALGAETHVLQSPPHLAVCA